MQWLKYYALAETNIPGKNGRRNFDPSKSPYEQFVSIGYTKRVTQLSMRCAFLRLTAETPIAETPIEKMIPSTDVCNSENNVYSALEVLLMKYPDKHDWVFNSLQ